MVADYTDYIQTTALLAILKAKAATYCTAHPQILIRSCDPQASERACTIAINTLTYNDRAFLSERLLTVMAFQLENTECECRQCAEIYVQ